MKPQTVLVTGATGFIARHIIRQLLDEGFVVVGSVRSDSKASALRQALGRRTSASAKSLERLRFVFLDANEDDGWAAAMSDVDVLIHTASPFPLVQPKDEAEVVRPAVEGTLRALRAAREAGIARAIVTSSSVAVTGGTPRPGRTTFDEDDWTDPNSPSATPYAKSKVLAELAAWDFVRDEAPGIGLTTVNPGFVVGTPIGTELNTSMKVVERILRGKDPMLPRVGFPVVDVEDIARMHVLAINNEAAVGRRLLGAAGFMWFTEIAQVLKAAYPDRRIALRTAPDWLMHLLSLFDPSVRTILPNLGRREDLDCSSAEGILGMNFKRADAAIRGAAEALANRMPS